MYKLRQCQGCDCLTTRNAPYCSACESKTWQHRWCSVCRRLKNNTMWTDGQIGEALCRTCLLRELMANIDAHIANQHPLFLFTSSLSQLLAALEV